MFGLRRGSRHLTTVILKRLDDYGKDCVALPSLVSVLEFRIPPDVALEVRDGRI
jgi:hypothetical protein